MWATYSRSTTIPMAKMRPLQKAETQTQLSEISDFIEFDVKKTSRGGVWCSSETEFGINNQLYRVVFLLFDTIGHNYPWCSV